MRHFLYCFILAGVAVIAAGCKAGPATQRAEQMDSRTTPPSGAASADSAADASPPAAPDAAAHNAAGHDAASSDSRPLIVCFGDSLTAGYGTNQGESYPDYLQKDLDAQGYKYRVVNEGVSGNTTKDGIDRLTGVIAMKPAVAVVEFGGNDGLRGLPIADSRANLDTIVQKLIASGSRVVIAGITLPPNYGADYIKQFNATYAILAKKYKVPMLPFLLKDVYNVPGMMQADETHATSAGNRIVASDVMELIAPVLTK